jgi:4'-phosphopantetheinyl transferase
MNRFTIHTPTTEVQVHRFSLLATADELAELLVHLTEEERERAERYKLAEARRQFIVSRGRLRELLGDTLSTAPREVRLTVEPNGKPVLVSAELHFNVTHSGELGLIALADQRIGIDLEQLREMPNAAGLIERFFSPVEREQFDRLPEEIRLVSFFRGWTCKEALMKVTGTGIHKLEECVVDLDVRQTACVLRYDPPPTLGSWQLATWEPLMGYVAALALESTEPLQLQQS